MLPVFETENDYGERRHHSEDTKQHSAERFKVLTETHVVGIVVFLFLFHDECFSKGKGSEKRNLTPSSDNILIDTPPPVSRDGRWQ